MKIKQMTLDNLKIEYPSLFPNNFLFECENGWYGLVELVCKKFNMLIERKWIKDLTFVQIKEKFGYLRIYVNCDYNDKNKNDMWCEINSYLSAIEDTSSLICEYCGVSKNNETNVETRIVQSFWYKTICDQCLKKEIRK